MIYLTILMSLIAVYFFYRAHRLGDDDSYHLAICLAVGAIGSGIVSFLSIGVTASML